MNRLNKKILFLLGILMFVVAKLYLIIPVANSLPAPRTGDDAMVYLWKGQLFFKKNPGELKALQDIQMQAQLPSGDNKKIEWLRSNIAGRVLGNISPTYSFLSAAAIEISPNLVWAYEITEIIGLLLMTIGISWFFYEIAGPAIAGFAMFPLAFAILPGQGIASFIPSNMTLSCFLILWAYLWRRKEKINTTFIGIYVFAVLGLHPIAKIYLALTPALYWIRLKHLSGRQSGPIIRLVLSLSIPFILTILLFKLYPSLNTSPLALKGSIDLLDGLSYNLLSAYEQVTGPFLMHNILWVFLVVGSILLGAKEMLCYPVKYFLIGCIILLFISLSFVLPGFPAELFKRLWVLMFILGSLIGGRFFIKSQNCTINFSKYLISATLLILTIAWWVFKYIPETMNNRTEIIIETKLKENIAGINPKTSILYPETDIALQASLLFGAENFGAIAFPMLKNTNELKKIIKEREPEIIIMPSDRKLNSLNEAKAKKFIQRKHGLQFEYVKEFEIHRRGGKSLNKVFLKFSDTNFRNITIIWKALAENGKILSYSNAVVANGIVELDLPKETEVLNVKVPEIPFWLTSIKGKSSKEPKINWPWNEKWQLRYKLRYKNKPAIAVEFNPLNLLEDLNAQSLKSLVRTENPVISDESGFLFIKTIF